MAVNKHLVLDASVILDLWLRPERATATEGLFLLRRTGANVPMGQRRQPEQALEWLLQDNSAHPEALSFIDLAAQQVALRPQIERNMDAVLRHGQFLIA
ncbi:hypothetical protein ACCAA_950005 [Candidatus Accumulibacter aalborgensis]|uniref:PIN domain-containing protein n=1 Tax=Candidatus Accumulibacter aalborgensis TaxID=1860102 RepID=A0A1A8Y014_9PROT|nr:hypothetical protein [Candidatus Accumulibacter aalborgensis]SBT10287.1 hypothetical protein ACCAA_950005 [Candidatus Accumulibacter aalborgensis]